VVCNNTNVSTLVFDYVSGWEKEIPAENGADSHKVRVAGKLPLFSNVEDGNWSARPKTILVDSEQLESGEAMSDDFRRIAAREIDEFKAEYRDRYPERDPAKITDEELLREVMNTVGKGGKLGEQVLFSQLFFHTDYNGESFFVRHAYFTGADEPYEKLKRALRAEIDEGAWSALYSTVSRPFRKPKGKGKAPGKIAIKVINHYGDEVLQVYSVG